MPSCSVIAYSSYYGFSIFYHARYSCTCRLYKYFIAYDIFMRKWVSTVATIQQRCLTLSNVFFFDTLSPLCKYNNNCYIYDEFKFTFIDKVYSLHYLDFEVGRQWFQFGPRLEFLVIRYVHFYPLVIGVNTTWSQNFVIVRMNMLTLLEVWCKRCFLVLQTQLLNHKFWYQENHKFCDQQRISICCMSSFFHK